MKKNFLRSENTELG